MYRKNISFYAYPRLSPTTNETTYLSAIADASLKVRRGAFGDLTPFERTTVCCGSGWDSGGTATYFDFAHFYYAQYPEPFSDIVTP